MKKVVLPVFVAVLSFGFVGCTTSREGDWYRGVRGSRDATVCGKEVALVVSPDDPGGTRLEYRVQLTWHDAERGAHPVIWSVVGEKTYGVMSISDKVVLTPHDSGQLDGHVTVKYMWVDERTCEINEAKYEYDLPKD